MILRLIGTTLFIFLLTGCSGLPITVGWDNVTNIYYYREGGAGVDIAPNTSWGNLERRNNVRPE